MRRHYSTEQYAVYKQEAAEEWWGQVRCRTQLALQRLLEDDSERQMADYLRLAPYERSGESQERVDSRNGFYKRDCVTALGVIRLRIRRTRKRSFLPRGLTALQRRAPEVAEIIRQAFLRGISTRAVGRVVATLTDDPVSAQTVSRLTRVLDREVEKFHHAPLQDDWAYLLLDGVWMKVRRAFGPQRVLLLVAYGVRANGQRQLLAFVRARAESQAAWEGFLWDLQQRGLTGRHLQLVLSDGAAGLAAALETVYPRARHQRCWVHKMRNLRDGVRRRDQAAIKRGAQRIYLARNARQARGAFQRFRFHWRALYPALVKRLERDLPDLLTFFDFPQPLWRKLRTTNAIERCFVEVRRRTRPMVLFVNVASVERIIYAIFHRFNQQWQNHTLNLFTQAA
jgi:transposase-like protein